MKKRPGRSTETELAERKASVAAACKRWDKTLGTVLAASRQDADKTQQEIANFMGWDRGTVVKIESGERSISAAELLVMAGPLNLSATTLLDRVRHWQSGNRDLTRQLD